MNQGSAVSERNFRTCSRNRAGIGRRPQIRASFRIVERFGAVTQNRHGPAQPHHCVAPFERASQED
jgi:hypothetical protein